MATINPIHSASAALQAALANERANLPLQSRRSFLARILGR